jgi:hypothetical protein
MIARRAKQRMVGNPYGGGLVEKKLYDNARKKIK